MSPSTKRASSCVLVALAVALAGWFVWPTTLGGRTDYLVTHGISMEPRFHTGDLAVLRASSHYRVGDVAAYHSPLLHTVVMHRIVAIRDGRYIFKGDNNNWLDPQPIDTSHLIGTLAVRIPDGGVWLHRLSGPPFVAVALFVLLTAGGAGGAVRRRKRGTMSRHAAGRARTTTRRARVETPAASAALAGVVVGGFALAAVAWSTPTQRTTTVDDARTQTMTFDYVAHVRRTAAYDGTVVHAPSPVFRAVTNTVDVDYAYAGQPGSLVVTAELGTPAGWHSDVKLAAPVTVGSARYQGHVTLNLAALWARGQAAAKVTGLPIEQMSVAIASTVTAPTGETFAASLPLTLSPAQLGLTDADTSHLTVSKPYHVTRLVLVDRQWTALHRSISVARARLLALALLAFAVMGAVALAVYRRRTAAAGEAAAITRRHADLLVEVEPIAWIPGRPLVDVRTFQTLARIAERYGLVVFHWARGGVDTYLVQDEAATYRYRTGAASRTVPGAPGEAGVDRSSEMVAP